MMQYTYLKHDRRLRYTKGKDLRYLPKDMEARYDCDRLVSFRRFPGQRAPDCVVKKLHAAMRPLGIYDGDSICFYAVQSDSPLAALLLWDAVHFMKVGQKITLVEDAPMDFYLDREYFIRGLKKIHKTQTEATYEKIAKFPAEGDDDLDSWTFGIPVGPEDASILNAVVKRILELDIPRKEIILCGRPGSNFAYFDKVRIVGEDIAAPPVQICKKKNRLAEEATYNNLVILHDRVFLPRHFGKMVRRFGPRYPLMGMQSMLFDDRLCLYPRRYSDYGMKYGELANGLKGVNRSSRMAVSVAPIVFTELEKTGFFYSNPMRYQLDSNYLTGSLYICRKEVWKAFPLDESLMWVEFEDIEHSFRAALGGVPVRLNPYGINQTITSRPLLGAPTYVEMSDGRFDNMRGACIALLPKKPLVKVSVEMALMSLKRFSEKYHAYPLELGIQTGKKSVGSFYWIKLVNYAIQQASFPNTSKAVLEFIDDYEKWVLKDQIPYGGKDAIYRGFMESHEAAKKMLLISSRELGDMLSQRPLSGWFYRNIDEYFHGKIMSLFGIFLSAFKLFFCNGNRFYFDSFSEAISNIYNSTPFKSYLEK